MFRCDFDVMESLKSLEEWEGSEHSHSHMFRQYRSLTLCFNYKTIYTADSPEPQLAVHHGPAHENRQIHSLNRTPEPALRAVTDSQHQTDNSRYSVLHSYESR